MNFITKEELEKNVDKPVILISAKEGKGIEELEEIIKKKKKKLIKQYRNGK